MTDEEMAAIEKACAEATPGPWSSSRDLFRLEVWQDADPSIQVAVIELPDGEGETWKRPYADATLICTAREALPALASEVRRLRAAVAEEREACAKVAEETAESWVSVRYPDVSEDGHRWAARSAKSIASAVRARGGG